MSKAAQKSKPKYRFFMLILAIVAVLIMCFAIFVLFVSSNPEIILGDLPDDLTIHPPPGAIVVDPEQDAIYDYDDYYSEAQHIDESPEEFEEDIEEEVTE